MFCVPPDLFSRPPATCPNKTDKAKTRLQFLVDKKNDPDVLGIRLGIRKRGCNGLSYTMDYAKHDEVAKFDEVVEKDGALRTVVLRPHLPPPPPPPLRRIAAIALVPIVHCLGAHPPCRHVQPLSAPMYRLLTPPPPSPPTFHCPVVSKTPLLPPNQLSGLSVSSFTHDHSLLFGPYSDLSLLFQASPWSSTALRSCSWLERKWTLCRTRCVPSSPS